MRFALDSTDPLLVTEGATCNPIATSRFFSRRSMRHYTEMFTFTPQSERRNINMFRAGGNSPIHSLEHAEATALP
jgi:hypothetical protein